MEINTTELERKVLNNIAKNNYTMGDPAARDWVWSWAVVSEGPHRDLNPKSVPGVVGSLVKKGLVDAEATGSEDDCVRLTEKGLQVWEAAVNEGGNRNG